MCRTILVIVFVLALLGATVDARKTTSGRSRGSGSRGSTSRRTNSQAAPTSFSNPSPAQPAGGSLFGWQTKSQAKPVQSVPSRGTQSHSYPSSNTGLSGNHQPPSYQQTVQQSHSYPQNSKPQQAHTYPQSNANPSQSHTYPQQNSPQQKHTYPSQHNAPSSNTQSHAYPASGGLSGHSGVGASNPGAPGGGYAGASAPAYPGGQQARPPVSGNYPAGGAPSYGHSYHQPPPAYSPGGYGAPGHSAPGYGPGFGGYSGYGNHGGGFGGGYGNLGGYNYGGMSRGTSTLTKVGIAGASVGTVLTGLALWNLARSGSRGNTYIYQDHRGNPIPVPANASAPVQDPILGELVNCTLTISGKDEREVIGIPCAIATSFTPNSDLNKGVDKGSNTQEAQCTVTVVMKNGTEFSTSIPCSIFLNTAKEANVTEPPPLAENTTALLPAAGIVPGVNGSDSAGIPVGAPIAPVGAQPIMPVGIPYQPVPVGVPYQPLPVGVPLAPMPADSNSNTDATSRGISTPASCKLEAGATPDPQNPCVLTTADISVLPLNNTATAPAAA